MTHRAVTVGDRLAGDFTGWSARTRELLGWRPVQPGLLDDLEQGHYVRALVA